MTLPFREHHLFQILNLYERQSLPLDLFLKNYFHEHHAVGSKDRRFIAENVYGIVRWRGLLDHLAKKPLTWESRYKVFEKIQPHDYLTREDLPVHVRVSFPKSYFQLVSAAIGEEKAVQFCLKSNESAPTTIRVNSLKTTRDQLLAKWKENFTVTPCNLSPWGIVFDKRVNFFALPEFKEGLFEVQDEGSQLIANLLEAKPGDWVLDYCAGSGGKTLAFAPRLEHRGQIFLHDIRKHALLDAKKRLKRAGIQNAQLVFPDDPKKNQLWKKMDWIFVDAPCSGSGTLRRNPDIKWKFDPKNLDNLLGEQQEIFAEALKYLSPQGKIIYATCSILPQENEEQVAIFQDRFGLKLCAPPFSSHPESGGMDGFFAAVFSFCDNPTI